MMDIEDLISENVDLRRQVESLEIELDRLRSDYEDLRQELAELHGALDFH